MRINRFNICIMYGWGDRERAVSFQSTFPMRLDIQTGWDNESFS